MTEQDWLTAEGYDAGGLLSVVAGAVVPGIRRASDRKLLLFACACHRRVWTLLTDERSRAAVEAEERFADGEIERTAVDHAVAEADAVTQSLRARRGNGKPSERARTESWFRAAAGVSMLSCLTFTAADIGADNAALAVKAWARFSSRKARPAARHERAAQLALLRDIVGNPFRPVPFDPSWASENVLLLARHIYESRDFSALPILADALQEAGCENDDVLAHCRGDGPHARGCWVVDLVLGKS